MRFGNQKPKISSRHKEAREFLLSAKANTAEADYWMAQKGRVQQLAASDALESAENNLNSAQLLLKNLGDFPD